MSIGSIMSTGLQGIQAGIRLADQAGGQIARVNSSIGGGNLAAARVDLKAGEIQVKAAAAVVRTGDKYWER